MCGNWAESVPNTRTVLWNLHVPQIKNDLDKMKNFDKSVGTSLKPAEKYVHLGVLGKILWCFIACGTGQDTSHCP
jgi:hypothetical protein